MNQLQDLLENTDTHAAHAHVVIALAVNDALAAQVRAKYQPANLDALELDQLVSVAAVAKAQLDFESPGLPTHAALVALVAAVETAQTRRLEAIEQRLKEVEEIIGSVACDEKWLEQANVELMTRLAELTDAGTLGYPVPAKLLERAGALAGRAYGQLGALSR